MPNFIRWLNDREKKDKPINIGISSDYNRSPYAGLCPADYKVPDKLSALQTELDQHIKELCKKGAVDAGNDTAADNYISSGIAVCAEEINYQRAERQRIIISLVSRWKGDLIDGQLKIEDFHKELEEVEQELSQAKSSSNAINESKRSNHSRRINNPSMEDELTEVNRNVS